MEEVSSILKAELTRRSFLKYLSLIAILIGFEDATGEKLLKVFAEASKRPPVIWISALSCHGCSESLLSVRRPSFADVILEMVSIKYHETFYPYLLDNNEDSFKSTVEEGRFILFVEGGLPRTEDKTCMVAGRPATEIVEELGKTAEFVVAVGSCASFGGIPSLGLASAISVSEFLKREDVVNLPTCPVHPEHLSITLAYLLYYGRIPELDELGRPQMLFSKSVHEFCERKKFFNEGKFAKDLNSEDESNYCLYLLGCKGTLAKSDCPQRRWTDEKSWCVSCNAGCQACSEKDWFERMLPLFEEKRFRFNLENDIVKVGAGFAGGLAASYALRKVSNSMQKAKRVEKVED